MENRLLVLLNSPETPKTQGATRYGHLSVDTKLPNQQVTVRHDS